MQNTSDVETLESFPEDVKKKILGRMRQLGHETASGQGVGELWPWGVENPVSLLPNKHYCLRLSSDDLAAGPLSTGRNEFDWDIEISDATFPQMVSLHHVYTSGNLVIKNISGAGPLLLKSCKINKLLISGTIEAHVTTDAMWAKGDILVQDAVLQNGARLICANTDKMTLRIERSTIRAGTAAKDGALNLSLLGGGNKDVDVSILDCHFDGDVAIQNRHSTVATHLTLDKTRATNLEVVSGTIDFEARDLCAVAKIKIEANHHRRISLSECVDVGDICIQTLDENVKSRGIDTLKIHRCEFISLSIETRHLAETSFSATRIRTVPYIRPECEFGVGVSFSNCKFDGPRQLVSAFGASQTLEQYEANARDLKKRSAELKHVDDELRFNALELWARELLEPNRLRRAVFFLYRKLSDHGRSLILPLRFLAIALTTSTIVFGLAVSSCVGFADNCTWHWDRFFDSAIAALKHSVPFVSGSDAEKILSSYVAGSAARTNAIRGFSILESFVCTILWFLVALALRNWFRMKGGGD